jgi:hypothetical protein
MRLSCNLCRTSDGTGRLRSQMYKYASRSNQGVKYLLRPKCCQSFPISLFCVLLWQAAALLLLSIKGSQATNSQVQSTMLKPNSQSPWINIICLCDMFNFRLRRLWCRALIPPTEPSWWKTLIIMLPPPRDIFRKIPLQRRSSSPSVGRRVWRMSRLTLMLHWSPSILPVVQAVPLARYLFTSLSDSGS